MLLLCVCITSQGVLSQPQGRGQDHMMMGQGRGGGQGMMGQGRGMMGQGMMMHGGNMLEGLDLTKDQQARIARIRERAMKQMQNANPERRQAISVKMNEQIHAVLTDQQRDKMMRQMHGGMGQGQRARAMGPLDIFDATAEQLQLTKAQQTKIAKLRADAMKKLLNDINGVLSEKQKVTFAQAQDRFVNAQKDGQGRGLRPMSEGRPTGGGRSRDERRGQRRR